MPNPLAITLHASAAETASGTGAAVDLGDRTYSALTLDASLVATGTTFSVTVETSPTGSQWAFAARFSTLSAVGTKTFTVPDSFRFLRVTWTIVGGPATFSVTGISHQLLATPGDVARYGLPGAALEDTPVEAIANACLGASEEAAGYLSSAYQLPLTTWDVATRKHVACMAAYDLMRFRGYDPNAGPDELLQRGRDQAVQWLMRIADGKLRPVGIVDSTPVVTETEVYVESAASRGWRR
jgi:phage gp36-like protein